MEISLEDLDIVRDRTGATNKEAKEALEQANGSVIDAIIYIEDNMDAKPQKKFGEGAGKVVSIVKEAIKKGNVSRIMITNEKDEILLNVPVNVSLIGVVFAPILAVGYIVAIYGKKCKITLVKTNGEKINITEKGAKVAGTTKDKMKDATNKVKEKFEDKAPKVKTKVKEASEKIKDKFDETAPKVKEFVKENAPKVAKNAKEFAGETLIKGKDFAEKAKEKFSK